MGASRDDFFVGRLDHCAVASHHCVDESPRGFGNSSEPVCRNSVLQRVRETLLVCLGPTGRDPRRVNIANIIDPSVRCLAGTPCKEDCCKTKSETRSYATIHRFTVSPSANHSAVVTLVESTSDVVLLLRLNGKRDAATVRETVGARAISQTRRFAMKKHRQKALTVTVGPARLGFPYGHWNAAGLPMELLWWPATRRPSNGDPDTRKHPCAKRGFQAHRRCRR